MKICVRLPQDRSAEGEVWVEASGAVALGPERCRGKADNAAARKYGNASRRPELPFGDTPLGVYAVKGVSFFGEGAQEFPRYGPAFVALDPLEGQALVAKGNRRTGLAIHGGELLDGGGLRATYGCVRVPDAFARRLGELAHEAIGRGERVLVEVGE